MVDQEKVAAAFREMRKAGLVAKRNFACCGSCARYEIAEAVEARAAKGLPAKLGVVFYHRQSGGRARSGGDLWVYFSEIAPKGSEPLETQARVGELAAAALRGEGLAVEWDGNPGTAICVRA